VVPLAYFGALGAVLAAIWFAQHGGHAAAAGGSGAGGSRSSDGGGGFEPIQVGADKQASYGSYQYNYGEQPGPDQSNPYGGVTDNATQSTSYGPGYDYSGLNYAALQPGQTYSPLAQSFAAANPGMPVIAQPQQSTISGGGYQPIAQVQPPGSTSPSAATGTRGAFRI